MPRPVRTLLAGTLIATTTFVGAATSQSLDNEQVQTGDVFSGQTLNVVTVDDQVTGATTATGNALSGAVQNGRLVLRSDQQLRARIDATTTMSAAQVGGATTLVTTAVGNTGDAAAYRADLTADVTQTAGSTWITGRTAIDTPNGRYLGGAGVSTTALANAQAFGVENGRATYAVEQVSGAQVDAATSATLQYVPAPAAFTTSAVSNSVSSSGTNAAQEARVVQRTSGGPRTQAVTQVSAGNAWNLAGTATAAANTATVANQGGSLDAAFDQTNGGAVLAQSSVSAYDFGAASSMAYGVGNSSVASNNDVVVTVDNLQLNTGGVEAASEFVGHAGYDGYASATAIGNATTGYACSECAGVLNANSRQINDADISATASINITGSNRAVVGTSTAIGNTASFYVSSPGG
ncbi:holdfast anchor protein HfaD [Caulobacter sp. 17J65-9]|uniref:holdfast anchor protein HfaD n=1 Tax=Caulobacter sp. 17J65-9 TaxID=2709382 RepID=UPI0013CC0701|nr:holdfast anchor protein HfaD [Caulobacter sp. 17J65-9]NEX92434.1 holdfast anchor protein HfaD [Caulobacter sp. 17J65-9]